MRPLAVLAVASALAACGGMNDASTIDAGPADAAAEVDAPPPDDGHRQWGAAQTLSTGDGADAWAPDLGVDAAGVFTVVWEQHGTEPSIHSIQLAPATGWGTATSIQTVPGYATSPHIAVRAAGDAVAVWDQYDGTHYDVWANHFVPGAGWDTAVLLETYEDGDASHVDVAIDPAGNATAIWLQFVGGRADLWASRFVPGSGWSDAEPIESDDGGSVGGVQIAVDADGNATAVWGEAFTQIWAARFIPGTGWEAPTLLEDVEAGYATGPRLAIDRAGRAIVGWFEFASEDYGTWMTRYVPGTGWETAAWFGHGPAPTIELDDAGNGTAVWTQSDVDESDAWTRHLDASAGWDEPMLLEHDAARVGVADVDVASAGSAVAVWDHGEIDDRQVHARRYVPGAGWGAPAVISTAEDAFFPTIALDPSGNAVAVWVQRDDGDAIDIVASTYR